MDDSPATPTRIDALDFPKEELERLVEVVSETGSALVRSSDSPEKDVVVVALGGTAKQAEERLTAAGEANPNVPVLAVLMGDDLDVVSITHAGAHGYVDWPCSPRAFRRALKLAMNRSSQIELFAARLLGRVPLREANGELRRELLKQSLAAVGGSIRGAARLLGVTRPAVQRMVREARDDEDLPLGLNRNVSGAE